MTLSLHSFTRFWRWALPLSVLLLGASLVTQAQTIRYVTPMATGTGDGSSWANASNDLQSQINVAGAQQVWVAQGTYKPGTDPTISFSMKNEVAIYGGFRGTETSLSQRMLSNPLATILSGSDISYHVIRNPPGLTNSAVLDGFIITGGNAFSSTTDLGYYGGGMYNDGNRYGSVCSPLIRNCSFQGNFAVYGGAIYNDGDSGNSSPVLINCSFRANRANKGGAIDNHSYYGTSSPVLTNCSFQGNYASYGGGAILNDGYVFGTTSPMLTNCVVWGNGGDNSIFTNNESLYNKASWSARYSLFETGITGYTDGGNNLTTDRSPFASTTSNSPFISTTDLALFACSPAVNAGLNSATGLVGVTTDLVGNARIFGDQVDMGAYEYQAAGGLTLTVPSVSTAREGTAFSQSFVASGGSSPYSYSLASGSLPTGLNLAANGTLSGTPTQVGSFSITVKATNATSCSGVSAAYVLRVASANPIRYVRTGATGNGTSWADANGDLQSQINVAGAEQVWVAVGTYKPGAAGNTDRTISFSMKNGLPIYGGFAGTETALSQRVLSNPLTTILSGDIGTAGNNADNSYHVVSNPPGLTTSAVLDGFLITSGNANGSSSPNDGGGGMLNNGSGAGNTCSPLIRNCLFVGNAAANGGGALYNAGYTNGTSSPSLINCAFQGNSAGSGGAISNDGSVGGNSNPSLTNCSFQANSAGSGGAMRNVAFQGTSRPVLTNCVVWGNGGATTFNNQQGAFITTSYSLFESTVTGYNTGTGNLTTTTSPFVSATDTRLNGCSLALNAGDNAAYTTAGDQMPPTSDLAGNARVFPSGGRIDMGAYEYQTAGGLSVSAPSVNMATLGLAFSQPFTASGGSGPYSYSLASGSLPPGLSLASTGVLSGTPTQVGSFTITVKATDATGCLGVSAPYVLTVDPGSPIRYVRAGASGSGNSWADASGNLQSQINVAGAQQVWVAQGTYKPTTGTDRSISFSMKNGVAIYGGFAGTETALAQRNPTSLTTVLSGNIGNAGSNTDNTLNVFSHPRELALNNTAVLDGFVIRDGYDTDQNPFGFYGGGMYNDHSSPTVTNCSFLDNTSFLGGGMYNNGTSNPVLSNCSFRGNTATNTGGGMYNNVTSNPMLTNCSFVGNRARFGGGMGNGYSSGPTLTNCSFVSNTASDTGGGMFNGDSNPTLINCSFLGNSSVNSGGGIYNQDSSPTLTNCVLFGNGGARTFSSRTGFSVTYSLLEPAVTGYTSSPTNLITTISPFVSGTDARLNACSPAINTGNNAANSTSIDLAGNPRVYQNGRIDMGAYEYQAAPTLITITAPSISTATVGVAFSQAFTASGGSAGAPDRSYSYSLVSGSLPTGLSLASTGTLSGTPTQVGSFTLTVLATDAAGCSGVSTPYVLTVSDAPSPNPTLTGLTASPGTVCAGSGVTFTATVGNVTGSYGYTLTNGLGSSLSGTASSSSFRQSVTASGTGTQTFTLTVSASGQSATSVASLTVSPLPVASLTNNGPLSCAQRDADGQWG